MATKNKQSSAFKREADKKEIKKRVDSIRIDTKKIHSFINEMNDAETSYIHHALGNSFNIKSLIKRFNITKKEFCEKVKINPRKYNDFVNGAYNYDIASLVNVGVLESELIEKEFKETEAKRREQSIDNYVRVAK